MEVNGFTNPQTLLYLWSFWPSWYAGRGTKEAVRSARSQLNAWPRRSSQPEVDAHTCDPLLPLSTLHRQTWLPEHSLWFFSSELSSLNILKEKKKSDNIHTVESKGLKELGFIYICSPFKSVRALSKLLPLADSTIIIMLPFSPWSPFHNHILFLNI